MKINNQQLGQTTVEYILLLLVIITVMTGVFRQIEQEMISGPNSLQSRFLQGFSNSVQGTNSSFEGQYKYFVIRR